MTVTSIQTDPDNSRRLRRSVLLSVCEDGK